MNIQEQLAIAAKLKKQNKNLVIAYAIDCEDKIKQLRHELMRLRDIVQCDEDITSIDSVLSKTSDASTAMPNVQ